MARNSLNRKEMKRKNSWSTRGEEGTRERTEILVYTRDHPSREFYKCDLMTDTKSVTPSDTEDGGI